MAPNTSSHQANIISPKWGMSLALVMTLVGAAVANLGMFASLRERVTMVEAKLDGTGKSLVEIKSWLEQLGRNTQSEIRDLHRQHSNLRERMTRIEAALERGK